MKRLAITAGLIGVGLAVPTAGQARCDTTRCLSKQVVSLQKQLKTVEKALATVVGCLGEAPVTRYGDSSGHTYGYVYNPGGGANPIQTTALDGTGSGQTVGAWLLLDRCNKRTTAPAHDVGPSQDAAELSPFGPIAPLLTLPVVPLAASG